MEQQLTVTLLLVLCTALACRCSGDREAMLTAHCDERMERDVAKFAGEQGLDPMLEGGQLLSVVQRRCETWLFDHGSVQIPVNIVPMKKCVLPIVIDGREICFLESDQASFLTGKEAIELGNEICLGNLKRETVDDPDCERLRIEIARVAQEAFRKRIIDAQRESEIMNHDATLPHTFPPLSPYALDAYRRNPNRNPNRNSNPNPNPNPNPNQGKLRADAQMQVSLALRMEGAAGASNDGLIHILRKSTVRWFVGGERLPAGSRVCFSVLRIRDMFSSGKPLDLGCEQELEDGEHDTRSFTGTIVFANMPIGPHRIVGHVLLPRELSAGFWQGANASLDVMVAVRNFTGRRHLRRDRPPLAACTTKSRPISMTPLEEQYDGQEHKLDFSIAILCHRGRKALRNALETWDRSGLLGLASERLIFVQEHSQGNMMDPRLAPDLPQRYNLTVLSTGSQEGISGGMLRLIERARSRSVLFLEEDFSIEGVAAERVHDEMVRSSKLLDSGLADVVRLRSKALPGAPNCALVWRGSEHLLAKSWTPRLQNHSVLESVFWLDDPTLHFPGSIWPCNGKRSSEGRYFCSFSTHASWSNNPILFHRQWWMENVAETCIQDETTRLEAAMSFDPVYWDSKCFVIAQGPGMFTHSDLDKPQYQQVQCNDKFNCVSDGEKLDCDMRES